MRKPPGHGVEVDSLAVFDKLVAGGAHAMLGWLLRDLDLRDRTAALRRLDPAGALLLGCELAPVATAHLLGGGALLFPDIPRLPFDPYRRRLYTPVELYEGLAAGDYDETPDARIYAWSGRADADVTSPLARALHDHSVDVALGRELPGHDAVGVMGGHEVGRGDSTYADAARLGRMLARGRHYVVTGGGPGAMEAANLGAYLSRHDDAVLGEALDLLAAVPTFTPSIGEWARTAFAVRDRWPGGEASLGIPTWFYGHEPPNAFASSIAKYFQNSLREDTLLSHCNGGIVFLPGVAGTVQEIFQDACENYYADGAALAPMVLVGERHWVHEVPAWPLLAKLAEERPMRRAVHLVDDIDDVPSALAAR